MRNIHATYLALTAILMSGACSGDETASEKARADAPTWHRDIAPLVAEKCAACHQAGGIAPFPMDGYAAVKPWAMAMAEAVEAGRMPPFLAQETEACRPRLPWSGDARLGDEQKAMLRAWADANAPEGSAEDAVDFAPPALPALEREDLTLRVPKPIKVRGTKDIHTCVVIDPELEATRYVVGRQITPGNPAILHHVISYAISPGQTADGGARSKQELIALVEEQTGSKVGGRYDCFGGVRLESVDIELLDGWAPGAVPNIAPADSGQPLDKDALIILDMHYHPTGGATQIDEGTKLSLMFASEPPSLISRSFLLGNVAETIDTPGVRAELMQQPDEGVPEFRIPAGAIDHVEEMSFSFKRLPSFGLLIYAAATHMHYVGRDMRVTLERAQPTAKEPDSECLIETPAWNFNWQRGYAYAAPRLSELPVLRNDDVLRLRCVYDNSMGNPFVARALDDRGLSEPVDVALGEDTLDEMCAVGLGIIYPNPEK